MSYRLFLDDIRTVSMVYANASEQDFVIVRNFSDFKHTISEMGLPAFISFDNDLGEDNDKNILPDGYHSAKWLVYESGLDLTELKFHVHSANPVAAEQIKGLLDNYIKYQKSNCT